MSNKYTCCIDKERLNSSIETLNSIDNCLNNRNLSNDFIDIEEIIKNINFNHNNCISDYKDKMNYILEELEMLKKDINNLSNSMTITVKEFSNVDEFKTDDIDNIFSYFNNNTDTGTLSVNNNLKVANNIDLFRENISTLKDSIKSNDINLINEIGTNIADVSDNNINTVPIGLGIGAAGITGAVGAVIVDSKNKARNESLYQYKPEEEIRYDMEEMNYSNEEHKEKTYDDIEEPKSEPIVETKKEEEIITPYSANRDKEKADKFYDDEENM